VTDPQRILILKPSSLGDVITAVPLLRGLRRTFPTAHISWLLSTACMDILRDDRDLNERIPFDRKSLGTWYTHLGGVRELLAFRRRLIEGHFDWVIDVQGLLRSALFARWTRASVRAGFAHAGEGAPWFYTHRISTTAAHTVDQNIELAGALGVACGPEDMNLHIADASREQVRTLLASRGVTGRYIVAVPPTRWQTKLYPTRHWRRVVEALSAETTVVLVGSPSAEERGLCAAIAAGQPNAVVDVSGQTKLPELTALIAGSAGVICSDSAAKFIAPAVGVECVCLMGPTRIERTGPYLTGQAMVADVPCAGCLKKRCSHISCMQSISPESVIATASELFLTGGL